MNMEAVDKIFRFVGPKRPRTRTSLAIKDPIPSFDRVDKEGTKIVFPFFFPFPLSLSASKHTACPLARKLELMV